MPDNPAVVAVDFSPSSLRAVHWAATHVGGSTPIIGVHAVDLPEPPSFLAPLLAPVAPAREMAAHGARERFERLTAEVPRLTGEVRIQGATAAVLEVARERRASLVVLGPHGARAGLGRMLGSTADQVSRESECPVVVVRGADRPVRRVLVAADDTESGMAALRWGADFSAAAADRELIALHVISAGLSGAVKIGAAPRERRGALLALEQACDRWLDERLVATGLPAARGAGIVRFGDPVAEILAAIDAHDPDLLVIGRGRSQLSRAPGSVASAMLRAARVSTVVVP